MLPWLAQSLALVPWTATSSAGHLMDTGDAKLIPEYVEVTSLHARNFTLRWRCEREPGDTYLVCTRPVAGNELCLESEENWATVSGLQPRAAYEVRVAARRAGAPAADFSAPLHIATPAEDKQMELTYKYVNMSAVRVSWRSVAGGHTVRHTADWHLPLEQWRATDATGNTALLTGIDPSKQLHVIVEGPVPIGNSPVLTIPPQIPEVKEVQYSYTRGGVEVRWAGGGPRLVTYSQNLTQPLDQWTTIDAAGSSVQIEGLDPLLHTFVMVTAPGPSDRNHVLTIKPRPPTDYHTLYLGIGIAVGVLVAILLGVGAVCFWVKRKGNSPLRSRRRRSSQNDTTEIEGAEMKNIGGRLANGGGGKDAGEPLLNGHVRITDNPTQSKTPNGKVRPRHEVAFDVTRFDDDACETTADVTQETILDTTPYSLLDTSRHDYRAPNEISREYVQNDFCKLPDDNMNSEVASVHSKLPTLSPNG